MQDNSDEQIQAWDVQLLQGDWPTDHSIEENMYHISTTSIQHIHMNHEPKSLRAYFIHKQNNTTLQHSFLSVIYY